MLEEGEEANARNISPLIESLSRKLKFVCRYSIPPLPPLLTEEFALLLRSPFSGQIFVLFPVKLAQFEE